MSELETKNESSNGVFFGFWLYLMTDLLMFAVLFAAYAVLHGSSFGGVTIREIFNPPFVLVETLTLLTSSFTVGLAVLLAKNGNLRSSTFFFISTMVLGLLFLAMELTEFGNLISEGNDFTKSAFLSSFFTLIGAHGLHIFFGILWGTILLSYIAKQGLTKSHVRKMSLLGIFWHFLDVVWIFIFTVVYLMGGIK